MKESLLGYSKGFVLLLIKEELLIRPLYQIRCFSSKNNPNWLIVTGCG